MSMEFFLSGVLRALFLSAIATLFFTVLLRLRRETTPNLRRVIWFCILVLGCCVFPFRVEIPVFPPVPDRKSEIFLPAASSEKVVDLPGERENRFYGEPVIPENAPMHPGNPIVETAVAIPHQKTESQNGETIPQGKSFFDPQGIAPLLFALWISGILFLFLRRVVQSLQLHHHLLRWEKGRFADFSEAEQQWANLLRCNRIAPHRVPILWTEDAGPALVFSLRGYRVLLPGSLWEELSVEHREGILRHELSHYLGRDTFLAELLRGFAVLQWFNPCAWFALKKYEEATEWKCDDFAYSRHEEGPRELVETLLSVHLSTESLGLHLSSFARINVLSRINRLLESELTKETSKMKKITYTILLLAFFGCGLFQPNLVAKPGKNGEPTNTNSNVNPVSENPGSEQNAEEKIAELFIDPGNWKDILQNPEFRNFSQQTQPEILAKIELALSMKEIPEITVERLRSVGNDIDQSIRSLRVENHEKHRLLEEVMVRTQIELADKIISMHDPGNTKEVPEDAIRTKRLALGNLARFYDYSPQSIAELIKLAEQCEKWDHPGVKYEANWARNVAAGMPLWKLEQAERDENPVKKPTYGDFLRVRKGILEFFNDGGTDPNAYQAIDLCALAGKMYERDAMNHEQLMETYMLLLNALSGEPRKWIRDQVEEQYRLLSLVGKPVEELSGTLLDGTSLNWDSYKGKTVLLAGCSTLFGGEEMEKMLEIHELYSHIDSLRAITCISTGMSNSVNIDPKAAVEIDRSWIEKIDKQFDYPGEIAVSLYAGDTKKLGLLIDLKNLNKYFSAHEYEYLGRTFMLIGSDGVVREIASDRKIRRELEKLFGPPNPSGEEKAKAVAESFRSTPKSCSANLHRIAIAMHNYHDVHGCFPPAYTIDQNGRKLHGWRTLLLPYLEQLALFKQIRMDEPWDSEHNKRFHDLVIPVYSCHELEPGPFTNYCVVLGDLTMFPENGKTTSLGENHDGTSNTIAVIERSQPVHWMEPTDIRFEQALKDFGKNPEGIGSPHSTGTPNARGCNSAFADGSVHFLYGDFPEKLLRAGLTIRGGESFSFPWME